MIYLNGQMGHNVFLQSDLIWSLSSCKKKWLSAVSFTGINVASSGGISLATLTRGLGRDSLGTGILHNLGITKTRSNTLTHLRKSLRKECHLSASDELNSTWPEWLRRWAGLCCPGRISWCLKTGASQVMLLPRQLGDIAPGHHHSEGGKLW